MAIDGWFFVNAGMATFFAIMAGYYMGDYIKRRWRDG